MSISDIEEDELLTQSGAAALYGCSERWFVELVKKRRFPPPVLSNPRRWRAEHIRRYKASKIKVNEFGIWYERDPETLEWQKLPNQYINTLPSDAA